LLSWPNAEIAARLTLPFTVDEDGNYAVRLTALQGPQFGRYEILIDNQRVGDGDFRAAEEAELDLLVCVSRMSKGSHELVFQALDAAAAGEQPAARPMAAEMLRLPNCRRLPAAKSRRITKSALRAAGARRALYAYRLAYGKLPDSLETLVEVGIMPARYLKDENELPLEVPGAKGNSWSSKAPLPTAGNTAGRDLIHDVDRVPQHGLQSVLEPSRNRFLACRCRVVADQERSANHVDCPCARASQT
jgi:hypothetical protein